MFRNVTKTTILLAGLAGLMVAIGSLFGWGGAVIGLVLGLALVGFSYWKSDALAIRAARAVPADESRYPQYYAVMRDLAERAEVPLPRLYVSPEPQPNAFATGRSPDHAAVAVTEGLLAACTWEEIRAVLAHEISHVRNRDILIGSVAAGVATGISFIANIAMWGAAFGGSSDDEEHHNPFVLLLATLLAPIAAALLQMALSRSREFEADRSGADLIETGEPLALALEKLEVYSARVPMNVTPAQAQAFIINPLTGRHLNFANLFRTHPTTAERVARLRGNR
jgi:heat shock protein HtpX